MRTRWFLAPALALLLCGSGPAGAADKKPPKEEGSFGTLRAPAADVARSQALEWLKGVGKTDEATQKKFNEVWGSDRPLLDKVADTLALGDAGADRLLQEARNPQAPAPMELPALFKDAKKPAFFRANLALAYGKALAQRHVYEDALETLRLAKVEQVVDPATYLFHRALSEHSLMLRDQADESIVRLLDDVAEVPERYKMVAALMHFDMLTWQDKDLGWIARKMENIQRRLDQTRGGQKTQKMQKEVVARLQEMIKELENRSKSGGS